MNTKQDRWGDFRAWLEARQSGGKADFKSLYMQQPVLSGFDLAASNGEFTVRWNKNKGYYERRIAGETHWERCG